MSLLAFLCLGNSVCCSCDVKWMNFRVFFKVPPGSPVLENLLTMEVVVHTGFFDVPEKHHFAAA